MNNDPADRRLQVFADPSAVARAAAEELTQRLIAAVRVNGRAAVALAGGSTPKALYALLADEPAFRERIPWGQTHFFFGDERHVPPDDKDSNYRMAAEAMLNKVSALCPPENVHRIRAENPDASEAAADYARELETFFGAYTVPRFDLVLLGMGPDGHTASLFPGTTGLREMDKLVTAAWVDKLSTYRITFTPPLLGNAAAILFLVAGKDKADTLPIVLEGPSEPDRYPSQGVTAYQGETLWLLDAAAAAKLSAMSSGK
jgi:6-phosphogluconolactonase